MEKYSDKFLNQFFKLKGAKLGFEMEFYMKDLSFYKTLEMLNQELNPVKVWGFRKYHSDFTPDANNFKLEPDLSGGSNMCEIITGPMSYVDSKHYLIKILKFIQNYGYTNDKCSIHFNLSFDSDLKDLNDLNILKLILNVNEDEIYDKYPQRKNNVYAKTIKKIIPFKEYDFYNIPIDVIKNKIRLPNDKYYGVNFMHINDDKEYQRLEFRYIGGKDYENKIGNILYFLDKFIVTTYDCIDTEFDAVDIEKLEEYLDANISTFKSFNTYDKFLVEYPKIHIQIDQSSQYEVVSSYYNKIYDKLYNIIDSTDNLSDCIINYVTSKQEMEIVDSYIKCNSTLSNFVFINSTIDGIVEKSVFQGCDINNSQISNSMINNSDITQSKILNCKVEDSYLKDCYFMNGYLNGEMDGGVFRSGELGPYANINPNVKLVDNEDNFFDTKYDDEKNNVSDDQIKNLKK